MTHLPYVAAAYAMGAGVPTMLALLAWQRLGRARRILRSIDKRQDPA